MSFIKEQLKKFLLFDEPEKQEKFILRSGEDSLGSGNKDSDSLESILEKKDAEAEKEPEPGNV